MKLRVIRLGLLIFATMTLVATPVLAYLYRAPITVIESNGTSYTQLPVIVSMNNDWLASNGFMDVDALDTRVQTLAGSDKPWMIVDDSTLFVTPVPSNSQTNLYFVTGESVASSMDIITGYDGYVTTTDAAGIELGNEFEVEIDGYIDTTAGSDKYLVQKDASFGIYVSGASELTAYASTGVGFDTGLDDSEAIYGVNWYGQTFTLPSGMTITSVTIKAYRTGSPGTLTVGIRATTGAYPSGADLTSGTIDADTFTTDANGDYYTIDLTPYAASGATLYSIVARATGGDASNKVTWLDDTGNGYAGGQGVASGDSGASWSGDGAGVDFSFAVSAAYEVVITGVTSGEHTVTVEADTSNLSISVDGSTPAGAETIAFTGTVLDISQDYIWMQNNTLPYANYITLDVSGVEKLRYEPIDIISGTTLVDETGTYDGAITWGSNPAGVSVTLGSLTSSGQTISTPIDTSTTPDNLPVVGGMDWNEAPAVTGALLTNPLRPIITAISDNTTLSERQVWVWLGIVFVAFITVLVGSRVRGHHLITGIAAGAAISLMVVFTIFPILTLLIAALAIFGGMVSERSPSL